MAMGTWLLCKGTGALGTLSPPKRGPPSAQAKICLTFLTRKSKHLNFIIKMSAINIESKIILEGVLRNIDPQPFDISYIIVSAFINHMFLHFLSFLIPYWSSLSASGDLGLKITCRDFS